MKQVIYERKREPVKHDDSALKEVQNEESKKTIETLNKFNNLVTKSNNELFTAKTVFPFTLFPKTIVIDELKVNIIGSEFFKSASIISIPVKDIKSIMVGVSLFFGTIRISAESLKPDPVSVSFLKSEDAYKIKRIVEGLHIIDKEGIDVSKINLYELRKKIEQIGTVKNTYLQ